MITKPVELASSKYKVKKYNLVTNKPNIIISEEAESLGCTWQKRGRIVWDKNVINRFFSLLEKRTDPIVVLDIGAQTGCYTLLAKFIPNSQWYAFEPIKEATDILLTNLYLNKIKNVEVINAAISDQSGTAILKIPEKSMLGLATLGSKPLRFNDYINREVRCIDLDSFITERKIPKVDFIKIDTEGWEYFVLQGGKEMICRDRPTILLEFNGQNMKQCGISPDQLRELLRKLGYDWETVSEDLICTPR